MLVSECPVCQATIMITQDDVSGDVITCPDCEAPLAVVTVDPLELTLAPEEPDVPVV